MYTRILAANDGSVGGQKALAGALELARPHSAEVHMVTVEELPRLPASIDEIAEEKDEANHRFASVIAAARARAAAAGMPIQTHDPHAAISDGIITGTGIECSMNVRARIDLLKGHTLERPIIAQGAAVHFVGVGPSVEEATEDAARRAVDFTVVRTDLGREEAYMLLSIIGELRVGTSPRPVMATRLIVPEEPLRAAGWDGELP